MIQLRRLPFLLLRNTRFGNNVFDTSAKRFSNVTVNSKNSDDPSAPKSGLFFDSKLEKLGNSREKIDVDGIKLNWDKVGNGSHVVLCLPGYIGTIETDFGKIFQQMNKEKFTIVAWDPPGHGRSRPPDRDNTGIFDQRDAHLASGLMNKLGYHKFSVLGWSNGGVTGLHIAQDFPDKVTNLVVWGSHVFGNERLVRFMRMMSNLEMWSEKMRAPMIQIYGNEYLEKLLTIWADGVENYSRKGLYKGLIEALPTIRCPTLVIHGAKDPVLEIDHAEFLHKHIQNSKLYVMPNAKHNLHLKFTDEFLGLVEKFLLETEK